MAIPIIVIVAIPVFFGLVYVSPFELPKEESIESVPADLI